jgi:motility quorum-sensing regulator / GCU-specific mRNA interferase toxin
MISMEKSVPHCKLIDVKTFIAAAKVRTTVSDFNGARVLDIHDLDGICGVVMSLTSANFYKSMTTYSDNEIWQDVNHATTADDRKVYLKLTVIDDLLVVSFKEL